MLPEDTRPMCDHRFFPLFEKADGVLGCTDGRYVCKDCDAMIVVPPEVRQNKVDQWYRDQVAAGTSPPLGKLGD